MKVWEEKISKYQMNKAYLSQEINSLEKALEDSWKLIIATNQLAETHLKDLKEIWNQ